MLYDKLKSKVFHKIYSQFLYKYSLKWKKNVKIFETTLLCFCILFEKYFKIFIKFKFLA